MAPSAHVHPAADPYGSSSGAPHAASDRTTIARRSNDDQQAAMYEDAPDTRPATVRPDGEPLWVLASLVLVTIASVFLLVALYSQRPLPWIFLGAFWGALGIGAMVVARVRRNRAQPEPRVEAVDADWPNPHTDS